jgi:chemotaxis family two-component system response regulator Rcp1
VTKEHPRCSISDLHILLIEDHHPDVRWVELLLAELKLPYTLTVLHDGEKALQFLSAQRLRTPTLVLLDINLPRVDGISVLEHIRRSPELSTLPVCILSGSEVGRERILHSYGLDNRCYLMKPLRRFDFLGALRSYSSVSGYADMLEPSGSAATA